MKGYRTIIVNAIIAAGTAGLTNLLDVDWVSAVGSTLAIGIVAAINMGLRWITTTPVLKAE